MEATFLQITWFVLFFVLIIGYAVLDGFDLGVGVLSLFNRDDGERRLYVNAIGPVWDGNEVWLLTGGGALFAAFPPVYATVFSGFYLPLMLVLVGLILRAVSMEFRSKVDSLAWRRLWDLGFGIGSLLPALLFGVAVGNILRGLPVGADGEFAGTFLGLLNPFALLCGVLGLVMFLTHGALYMAVKSDGDLRDRMLSMASKAWVGWVVLFIGATLYGFFEANHLFDCTLKNPVFWVLFAAFLGSLLYQPVAVKASRPFVAFVASSLSVATLIGMAATGLFPTLVPSTIDAVHALTIMNASSTERTLTVMLVIAGLGMPLVIGYTAFIYRVFKGKVVLDESSY
ncbi:MAG: cytochrome d ubiquinol oxidase subunit II [Deltaproteobacteria bacterium]|nr:cytochrome d ubiquinol oxidase subunit II [Deltaproteobacteria bacterium]